MMEPAERDREFVADLAVQRARLREAKVMCFGGRAAADDAGLHGDEFAVLLVAQTNGLGCDAAAANNGRCRSGRFGSVEGLALPLPKQIRDLANGSGMRSRLSLVTASWMACSSAAASVKVWWAR